MGLELQFTGIQPVSKNLVTTEIRNRGN